MSIFVNDDRIIELIGVNAAIAENEGGVVGVVEICRAYESLGNVSASRCISNTLENSYRRRNCTEVCHSHRVVAALDHLEDVEGAG